MRIALFLSDRYNMNSLSLARHASVVGMFAHQYSMKCHTQNLAHAGLKATNEHNYIRKIPHFSTFFGRDNKLQIRKKVIADTTTPYKMDYRPDDPDADKRGFVKVLNINPLIEITDLQNSKHQYMNCIKVYELLVDSERRTANLLG